MLTCSHTLSSISISRNLYIESSWLFVFCFLAVCQMGAFLSSFSPFGLSEMYCPLRSPLLYTERLERLLRRIVGASPCGCPGTINALERLIHQQHQNSG